MFGAYAWAWKWNDTWHRNVPVIFFWRSRKTAELNIESSCVGRAPVSELRWRHSRSVTSRAVCEKPRASPKLYVLFKTSVTFTENLHGFWGFFCPFFHSLNAEKFSHTAKGRACRSTALQHCVLLWNKRCHWTQSLNATALGVPFLKVSTKTR